MIMDSDKNYGTFDPTEPEQYANVKDVTPQRQQSSIQVKNPTFGDKVIMISMAIGCVVPVVAFALAIFFLIVCWGLSFRS